MEKYRIEEGGRNNGQKKTVLQTVNWILKCKWNWKMTKFSPKIERKTKVLVKDLEQRFR